MTLSGTKKWLEAVKGAEITEWIAQIDGYNFYHGKTGYNFLDEGEEQIVNIQKNTDTLYHTETPYQIRVGNLVDIHEMRVITDKEHVKKFVEQYGIELTQELKDVIVRIDATNKPIIPVNGDYTFRVLSESEVAKLDEKQKERYEQELKAYTEWMRKNSSPVSVS